MSAALVHHFTAGTVADAKELWLELSELGLDAECGSHLTDARRVDVTARVRVDEEPDPNFAVVLASLFNARYLGVWRYYACDKPECRCNVLVRGERVWP